MKRVMFEYDMFGGFVEIREKHFLHPESDALWTDHGEIPDVVWARYEAAVKELQEAHRVVGLALMPISLSAEEAAEAQAAWEKVQAEEALLMEGFQQKREATMAECPHTDKYGSLFMDGSCMVCGFRQP